MTKRFLGALGAVLLLAGGSTALTGAAESGLTIEAKLGTASYGLGSGYGSIWAVQSNSLLRIDVDDNSISKSPIPGKGGTRSIAVGEGAVWLPDGESGSIYKVDPQTNEVVLTIDAHLVLGEGSIGVGAGSVWVMTVGKGKAWVARYSATTGEEQAQIPLRPSGLSVLYAHDAVWVSGSYKNEVYRLDPATNTVAATIKVPGGPRQLAASEDAIWAQSPGKGGAIHRIDPKTNTVVASIDTDTGDDTFASITVGGGMVWAAYHEGFLLEIDPATNTIVSKQAGDDVTAYTIVHSDGSLWLSGYGSTIYRFAPPSP